MPGADGTTFAVGYADSAPPLAPIIALCASRDGEEWSAAIGAAALVTKPFDIDDLLGAIASVAPATAGEAS
jgi:CheY-like chemotaxis protein